VPGQSNPDLRQLLFIPQTNDFMARWQGPGLTQEAAAQQSGVTAVHWLHELDHLLDRLLAKYPIVYLNPGQSLADLATSPARRRAAVLRERLPLQQLRSALPQLAAQRAVKAPAEVAQIRAAIAATAAGLGRAAAVLKPGLPEYALEAELTAQFIRSGAAHAFNPIVATGAHATTIHHQTGAAVIGPRDLVLLDVGAEAGYYAADISRVRPAAGRLTDRQRAIYQTVYDVQQAAIALHKPGASIVQIDQTIHKLFADALPKLGLKQPVGHYYPHLSHHLGLDVHDPAPASLTFQAGMVVTCEPGLYLPEEGIGVRLEDDILITEAGCEVLSAAIPSDPEQSL